MIGLFCVSNDLQIVINLSINVKNFKLSSNTIIIMRVIHGLPQESLKYSHS